VTAGRLATSARLPASPVSARLAREMIREVLDEPIDDMVALIVSELVTNAVHHAGAAPVVSIELEGTKVRIEVFDNGPGRPVIGPVSTSATSGRGVALVDAVADRWGVEVAPEGKTVWAEVLVGP
jgi:anti-sigma regulatory factor (Ser/Thr protein kinase)